MTEESFGSSGDDGFDTRSIVSGTPDLFVANEWRGKNGNFVCE
jgi:hypothetical protein